MDKLYLHEIADAVGGKVIFGNPEVFATSVITDSRIATDNSLFVRFGEDKAQSVDFLLSAFEKGASIAIVTKIDEDLIPSERKGLIQVDDSEKALMRLEGYYRKRLTAKIVAVSGSTGKTSIKDMLFAMLSKKYKVFKTEGNKNNNIGLPLMVLNSDVNADICIFEMGMDKVGEIHALSDIVRQDVAVLTNIGMSHIESLGSQENIFKAKMEIADFFNENNILFLNADDKFLKTVKNSNYKIVTAGIENGEYRAKDIELKEDSVEFNITLDGEDLGRVTIEGSGLFTVSNAILCFSVANKFGIKTSDIKTLTFDKTKMRKEKINYENVTVINDSYNASPDSMKSGIDVLQFSDKRKVAILGDMLELGSYSAKAHEEVGAYAKGKIDMLIYLGEYKDDMKKGFGNKNFYGFDSFIEAEKNLKDLIKKDDIILLKASRGMKFGRFLEGLERI